MKDLNALEDSQVELVVKKDSKENSKQDENDLTHSATAAEMKTPIPQPSTTKVQPLNVPTVQK